jgi:HD-GYP domain-containing protein (c-di-GMP phosphodiesterase class II)
MPACGPASDGGRLEKAIMGEKIFNILGVDDDRAILDIYRGILETVPERAAASRSTAATEFSPAPRFKVACCSQAQQAVEAVCTSVREQRLFSAIFLDVSLPPGPSGLWAAEEILKADPTTNIVLVTGFIGSELEKLDQHLTFSDRLLFLQKPFHSQEIVQFAIALSAKWQAEQQVRTLNASLEGQVAKRTAELVRSNAQLQREAQLRKRVQHQLQESLENLKRIIGGTVLAIARTVEQRDPYTSGHQHRVAELCKAIGLELGLSEDRIEGLFIASAIHDIGKVSLPAEILSKPSQLNSIEISLIQGHAQSGFDILKSVDFPWPVAQIVLQHHERLDGSGYPQGLAGDDILLEARIVGVADVVETMSSHRPYRPSRGLDSALEEISTHRGILYDRDAVDACLTLMQEGRFAFTSPVFA